MTDVRTIILHQQRHEELVNGEHPYSGSLELQNDKGERLDNQAFVGLKFHQMMTKVSRILRENPDAAVTVVWRGKKGLLPVQLEEELRVLLRDDPVQAIRSMSFYTNPRKPMLRAGLDTLADAFGERVYLSMRNGMVQDPISSEWRPLAFGARCGWLIRGKDDAHRYWLPIHLEGISMPQVETPQEAVDAVAAELAICRWASVSMEDLLNHTAGEFFIPRVWNERGPWITKEALRQRFAEFEKSRKEALT